MKIFTSRVLVIVIAGLCASIGVYASDQESSPHTKAVNEAHSNAPAPVSEGAATGSAASGAMATGESMQGLMSPAMTKLVAQMKKCHRHHKTDQRCHDDVMKNCAAKLTKEECGNLMAGIPADKSHKM